MERAGRMRIVVTGAGGLLGRHAALRLHAENCAPASRARRSPSISCRSTAAAFADPSRLRAELAGAGAVLHFAGINRAPDEEVEHGNPAIATALVSACRDAGVVPHIVYANSTHAGGDTPYGRGKRRAGEILAGAGGDYTDLVLPHIFGEGARPDYNNVTATFIDRVIGGDMPKVNPDGRVELLHAGAAGRAAIDAALSGTGGRIAPQARPVAVPDLLEKLRGFHADYAANVFPDLADPFRSGAVQQLSRSASIRPAFPRPLKLNADPRGTLFGGGEGRRRRPDLPELDPARHHARQPFPLSKVERFLVLEGQAAIRIRPALAGACGNTESTATRRRWSICRRFTPTASRISGRAGCSPCSGRTTCFDPAAPDTYADPVLEP
ncbi:NAD-dependent epimerase/dehydratase family protein [Shinella sp. S4-D37]|uniref:NAD-dependent epimerase/dehydratase family protein n=1 Tax=Shinella sp. S4-D37 TaxID=3161999 RepID=UPI003465F3A2